MCGIMTAIILRHVTVNKDDFLQLSWSIDEESDIMTAIG